LALKQIVREKTQEEEGEQREWGSREYRGSREKKEKAGNMETGRRRMTDTKGIGNGTYVPSIPNSLPSGREVRMRKPPASKSA